MSLPNTDWLTGVDYDEDESPDSNLDYKATKQYLIDIILRHDQDINEDEVQDLIEDEGEYCFGEKDENSENENNEDYIEKE